MLFRSDALVMGKPGVLLALASQFGANTLEATHELEEALEELEPIFKREGIEVFPRLHRPATFIEVSLHSIQHALVLGGVLVAVVLFLIVIGAVLEPGPAIVIFVPLLLPVERRLKALGILLRKWGQAQRDRLQPLWLVALLAV